MSVSSQQRIGAHFLARSSKGGKAEVLFLWGKPSELEYQTCAVVRYGEASGVPTPVNFAIYAALLPSELRAGGKLAF